jgi:hypothetical protein
MADGTDVPMGSGTADADDLYSLAFDQDGLPSVDEDARFEGSTDSTGAQALAVARAHLAAVAEELASIQEIAYRGPLEDERVDAEGWEQERQELLLKIRHLEVDKEGANERADKLAQEKEELLAAQARMEAEVRTSRKNLEEAHLRIQHHEVDLRKRGGAGVDSLLSLKLPAKGAADDSMDKPSPAPLKEVADQAGLAPRPAILLSKQQAVATLRAAQVELREERKRRERLERRVQKDKERLDRFVYVAEGMQDENRQLKQRCQETEASAQECLSRLKECMEENRVLHRAVYGARQRSKDSMEMSGAQSSDSGTTSPFASRTGSPGTKLSRNQSAPTRLPDVTPKRS